MGLDGERTRTCNITSTTTTTTTKGMGTQPDEVVPPAQTAEPIYIAEGRHAVPITQLRFGTPEPPKAPYKTRSGPTSMHQGNKTTLHNQFAPLGETCSVSGGKGNEDLSSGILRGGSASATSSSRGSRGRDPIPLTPKILQLQDRLELDKGRHARLLTEHLTGQNTLPYKEQELRTQQERKAVDKEIKS